jgi:hypothetical protein
MQFGAIKNKPAMIFFFFFGCNGVRPQGFTLAGQVLHGLSHTPSPFTLVILEIGSCFLPRLA